MLSVVLVGSTRTALVAGRMVTPREYRWLSDEHTGPAGEGREAMPGQALAMPAAQP